MNRLRCPKEPRPCPKRVIFSGTVSQDTSSLGYLKTLPPCPNVTSSDVVGYQTYLLFRLRIRSFLLGTILEDDCYFVYLECKPLMRSFYVRGKAWLSSYRSTFISFLVENDVVRATTVNSYFLSILFSPNYDAVPKSHLIIAGNA